MEDVTIKRVFDATGHNVLTAASHVLFASTTALLRMPFANGFEGVPDPGAKMAASQGGKVTRAPDGEPIELLKHERLASYHAR